MKVYPQIDLVIVEQQNPGKGVERLQDCYFPLLGILENPGKGVERFFSLEVQENEYGVRIPERELKV